MKTERTRFYTERNSLGVHAMVILMTLSIVFRIIGCWGLWRDSSYAITQVALPVVSALLLIILVWLLGKRALWLSFIPVALGAVYFIINSLGFENKLHMVLCILLDFSVIVLFFCTVFGIIRTKWILVLLFGLPFLYHIFVRDLAALRDTANPVSFAEGMQEMSVLCIMLGLVFLSISMKKTVKEHSSWRMKRHRAEEQIEQPKTEHTDTASQETTAAAEREQSPNPVSQQIPQTEQTSQEPSPEVPSESGPDVPDPSI